MKARVLVRLKPSILDAQGVTVKRALAGLGFAEVQDVRVGKVVNKYKVAKHFALDIEEHRFGFHRLEDNIASEAALDGIYIIRTSLGKKQMTAADCVRNYKSLAQVERAFRSLKTIDLKIRPIHHHLADRVRSHIFLCMLAMIAGGAVRSSDPATSSVGTAILARSARRSNVVRRCTALR